MNEELKVILNRICDGCLMIAKNQRAIVKALIESQEQGQLSPETMDKLKTMSGTNGVSEAKGLSRANKEMVK